MGQALHHMGLELTDMGDMGDVGDKGDMGNISYMGDMGYISDNGDMGDFFDIGGMGRWVIWVICVMWVRDRSQTNQQPKGRKGFGK